MCLESSIEVVGHVGRMDEDNWVKKSREIMVVGQRGRGRPQKTWAEVVRGDLSAKNIDHALAQNRAEWRKVYPWESLS